MNIKGELLWVYEGLTTYLGNNVLTPRSGLLTPQEYRERLATVAARLDRETGRQWRRKPRESICSEQKANLLILGHSVSFALQVNHGGPCD